MKHKWSVFSIIWLVLSLLCLVYSGMVYMVGSGTFSFVIWLAGAAFFGVCFFLSRKGRWAAVPKIYRLIAYTLITLAAAIFITCQVAILSHFFDKGQKDLDYVIVLGAQMRSSGPSVIYRYRLQKASEYLEENPNSLCITTGAKGSNEPISEGEGGAEYLVLLGIPETRILVESDSFDTSQNIQNALKIIEEREGSAENLRIGILTNGFHVYRGVHIAKGLTDAEVCGIAAYMQPQYIPNNMVRETLGILRDFMSGKIKL